MLRRVFAIGAVLAGLSMPAAHADNRVALVIGNASYQNTQGLANPVNDAEDVAAALKRVGFNVILERDLDKRSMEAAIARFSRLAQDADAALFFYAGHGMQFRGSNYLMPIDSKLEDEFSLNFELTRIEDVLFGLERARGVKLLILDACRDNPLLQRLTRSGSNRSLAAQRGLARIEATRGMLVAYSTQTNQVAADGTGRNSPFAGALVKHIEDQGIEIGAMFRRVATEVDRVSGGQQLPEISISLLGDFFLNGREAIVDRDAKAKSESDAAESATREALLREQAERERLEKERLAREQLAKIEEERNRLARELAERQKAEAATKQATLTPPPELPKAALTAGALVLEIKKELKRVGCYAGPIDENWSSAATRSSVEKYVKLAKLAAPTREPGGELLDSLRGAQGRICPIQCGVREVERDGKCVARSCPDGQTLDARGACVKRQDNAALPSDGKSQKPGAASANKCSTKLQARCAVEVGGTCDPATGNWQYGGAVAAAFNACLDRAAAKAR